MVSIVGCDFNSIKPLYADTQSLDRTCTVTQVRHDEANSAAILLLGTVLQVHALIADCENRWPCPRC